MARRQHDLTKRDAVLLLEERRIEIAPEGAVSTTVHTVVWIGTATGIRAYADLRIPWNEATCSFAVTKLRTWRNGRWWPDAEEISDTAVVHTLPYAVDHADHYTTLRETMLLHDGVELPCIMETEYTLNERALPAADGLFVLPQRDAAVLVRLSVSAPADRALNHAELNGAPAPTIAEQDGRRALTWTLQPAAALRLPLTAAPAAYEPAVCWSTWADERALGDAFNSAFWEAAVAPRAVVDSLRNVMREAGGERARVQAGGKWLARNVRHVHQDDRWWTFAPRRAELTWETAYGHVLDRAVLWASLLKADGWQVLPVLAGPVGAPAAPALPHLGGRGQLLLYLQGAFDAQVRRPLLVCDPADFSVHAEGVLDGRPLLWLYGEAKNQAPQGGGGEFTVELSLAAGDTAWAGAGFVSGRGRLGFADAVDGEPSALGRHAAAVMGGVLKGATTPAATLPLLLRGAADLRCDVAAPLGKADADGRRQLVVGRPKGGLLDRLPGDCRPAEAVRAAPVLLDGPLRQVVAVRLKLPAGATVALPEGRALTNAAGSFTLTATHADGWVEYRRDLALSQGAGAAANWPALRALLLEEGDAANATMAWRTKP
ncbi:DUF3857 domain-containing protein [bacterium]|nr:DUF3857 domain-containing protein [bacterium]